MEESSAAFVASSVGRTQAAAQHMLRDFATNRVDEDLEMLRSMWKKPPTPPESDEDDEEANGFGRARARSGLDGRVPWRGVIDDRRNGAPTAFPRRQKPPPELRVKGGALDYRSSERLGTLSMLRHVAAATPEELSAQWGDGGGAYMALTMGSGSMGASRSSRASSQRRMGGETEIERAARHGAAEPSMDWAAWESKWAEQLKELAAAAERARRMPRQPHPVFDHVTDSDDDDAKSSGGTGEPSRWQHRRSSQNRAGPCKPPQQPRRPSSPGAQRRESTPPNQPPPQQQQQPPPRPPPQRRPPPPAQQAAAGRQFSSWSAFDAAFTLFEAALPSMEVVRLSDVPFPPSSDPAGLAEAGLASGGDASQRKKLLRKALLRWHPDKWAKVTGKVREAELAPLGERLRALTQALVEQKD